MTGSLAGIRVLELGGLGPVPFAGMMLADMGADVVRVDRPDTPPRFAEDVLLRGRRSILLDLKTPAGLRIAEGLVARADIVTEGFRPGTLERIGLSSQRCLELNPAVVIGRMTGWGQDGPLARVAGHDINYISVAGALHTIGPRDGAPAIPLNLIGDFGGGGMLLAFGVLCAVLEARASGSGQVVDAAMLDGSLLLMAKWYAERSRGRWHDERGVNRIDGGAHYYNVYPTSDGRYLSVGAVEPAFHARLLELLGIDDVPAAAQHDPEQWPRLRDRIGEVIANRTRDDWMKVFDGEDACVTPVLSLDEAAEHPQLRARDSLPELDGVRQPAAAPRLSRTPGRAGRLAPLGSRTDELLGELGYDEAGIRRLRQDAVVR